jgi:hypothetical protein
MTLGCLAAPLEQPAQGMTEQALFHATRATDRDASGRSEPCICGGQPIAVSDAGNAGEMTRAIDIHNASTAHELWRRREGIG